jgi:FtsP/CotA-like multicopper oxidase with cupredoxin domain
LRRRKTIVAVAASAAALLLVAESPAPAEPLRDVTQPLCSSVDADFAAGTPQMSPNCAAPVAAGRRDVLEIALTAARGPARIGDFMISDAYLYNQNYAPEVWSVDPGDSILVTFENDLSGATGLRTNLHVHGFIVSPNNAPGTLKSPLGDNVFAYVYAGDAAADDHMTHAAPDAVPTRNFDRSAEYLIEIPADHPKGLFWYHPHSHGISEPQVTGGMSGLITIGGVSDYVATELKEGVVEEKLLMLKDMQITREAGAPAWRVNPDYNADNCEQRASKEPGVCFKDENNAWLFPVNGQIFPTIDIAKGAGQLWRIGNIGADASYRLELVEITDDGTEEPMPFQVISIDGVAVGRESDKEPILRDELLIMPSARVEVLVAHPGAAGQARRAVLRTTGFGTGATPDDGDNWPAIDLAEVVFADSLVSSQEDSGLAFVAGGGDALDFNRPAATSGNAACPRLADGEVRIVAFDIAEFADSETTRADFAPPPGCMVNQEFDIIGNIATSLADDSSVTAILSAYDKAVGDKYSRPFGAGSEAYRGKCFDGGLDTCVPYPSVEAWWVVNASNEGHNFHIHQTRFQVLEVRGAHSAFTPVPIALNDNYPVLAGQAIKVRIALNRPEQIGTFVYHCHILEHGDNGMMAAIEVREVD